MPLLVLNFSVGINLGSLDVGLPALLHHQGDAAANGGILIAALSLSSAATVLALSTPAANRFLSHHDGTRIAVLAHAAYGLLLIPLALLLLPLPLVLAVVLVAGCFLGPAVSFTFAVVPERVSPDRHGEAFSLFSSVSALGTALGTMSAGFLVDLVSPSAALAVAVLPAIAALGVSLTIRRKATPRPAG